jgi:prepilin-type N-terminal cleavage/methylation domain-containing protein
MNSKSHQTGFTLVELLIGIVIIGMILAGLSQVLSTVLSSYQADQASQTSVPEARYALERMVMFVQETDQITAPSATAGEQLTVSERVSDQYDNISHAYKAEGDGYLDADNDHDNLLNEDEEAGDDPWDFITFELVTTDANNWKLMEKMPDYTATGNPKTVVICEHIKPDPLNNPLGFSCRRLLRPDGTLSGIVEIILTVQKGSATVTLKTTAKSRWVE